MYIPTGVLHIYVMHKEVRIILDDEAIVTDYDGNEIQTAEEAVKIMDAYLEMTGNPYI